jgi:hypothetical protein
LLQNPGAFQIFSQKSVLQTEQALRANLPNTLLQSTIRKTLRAGIDDQKGRRGAKAIAPEADFASFQEQNPLNSNVREAGAAI